MTQPVPNNGIRHPIDDVTACDILHQVLFFLFRNEEAP